jgi:hypothetical protein
LRESLQLYSDVGDWPHFPTRLESLAHAIAIQGQAEQAVRLLGAAAALREVLQLSQTPRERTAIASWLPTLRHHLGAEAFEAAGHRRRALSAAGRVGLATVAAA